MKRKFNKEERKAIIAKLRKIANEREKESWERQRKAYQPSEEYLQIKQLLEERDRIIEEILKHERFICKFDYKVFGPKRIQNILNNIRDEEIEHLVTRYNVNETDLDVEIILADQDRPVDDIIMKLLNNCLRK